MYRNALSAERAAFLLPFQYVSVDAEPLTEASESSPYGLIRTGKLMDAMKAQNPTAVVEPWHYSSRFPDRKGCQSTPGPERRVLIDCMKNITIAFVWAGLLLNLSANAHSQLVKRLKAGKSKR